MRLRILLGLAGRSSLNCGVSTASVRANRHCRTVCFAAGLALLLSGTAPTMAQQAAQPGFDPKQTERRFDALDPGQTDPARSRLRMPQLAQPQAAGDTRPQFVLRAVILAGLAGATAMPREAVVKSYQSYLGKKVSQADLAAIATAISDLYRAAGFHLSRAIAGRRRRPGPHPGDRGQHHRGGAEG